MATLKAADVLGIAKKLGVTRGGVQEILVSAETAGEMDQDDTLNVIRALLLILEAAEAAA